MARAKPTLRPSPLKQVPGSDQTTTFRTTYQPHDVKLCHTKSIPPPPPALLNISSKISPVNVPETYNTAAQSSFRHPKSAQITIPLINQERSTFDRNRIYSTNFKMSVDHTFNGFSTTNCSTFSEPRPLSGCNKSCHVGNYSQSVLKLSDPSLLGNRVSYRPKPEYADSFRKPISSISDYDNQFQRLMLRNKQHLDHVTVPLSDKAEPFLSTAMDTYRSFGINGRTPLPLSASLQQNRITSIPFGDREKVSTATSTCQDTYRDCSTGQRSYDRGNAHSIIYQSSIKLGDAEHFNEARSSALLPLYSNPERRKPVMYDRNASSFPPGDLDHGRVKERLTSVRMFPKPPHGSFPTHVDSSNFHTMSYVPLGNEGQSTVGPMQSTMKNSYNPLESTVEHARAPLKDNIPFDYEVDLPNSTVKDSFREINQSEVVRPNPVAQENLRKSHWQHPYLDTSIYRTTHQSDFYLPPVA